MQTFARKKPFVDVILPNYNKAEFLEDAINSVITQTYKNWHLYIVDDHSNDNSVKVIASFCRNYAMRISKAKYISFIDSDDTWLSDKLEKQIIFMEKHNLSFTYTDYTPFFESFGKKKIRKRTFLKDHFNYRTFLKNSSINTTTMIIARSIIGRHRFRKIKLLEDYLFKCKLLKK